jgi:putative ABC transport system substrate-binding protein
MLDLRRREFITLIGGAAAWPLAANAQQQRNVSRIGYLSPAAGPNPVDEAFEEGLRQHGWTKDQNIRIEYRYTGGRQDTVSPLATEVIGLGVDALVTWGPPLSLAVKQAGTQIPLVFLITFDPVDIGLVSNLARPGGNVTGVTSLASLEIFAKRLQLATQFIPSLARVAVLVSTEQTRTTRAKDALTAAAKGLGIELHDVAVQTPSGEESGHSSALCLAKWLHIFIREANFRRSQCQSLTVDPLVQGRCIGRRSAGICRRSKGRGAAWCGVCR